MNLFCSPDITWTEWSSSQCHCDWINVFISLCSLYIFLLLVAYLRWTQDRGKYSLPRKFYAHDIRGCISIALLLSHLVELSDAALSFSSTHVITVPSASLAFWASSAVLSNVLERTGRYRLLLVPSGFWIVNGLARCLRLGSLLGAGVPMDCLRPLSAAVVSGLAIVMGLLDLLSFFKERRRTLEDDVQSPTTPNCKYNHDDAHFLSRCTFYWLTPLLRHGFSNPLEMEDLGNIPDSQKSRLQLDTFTTLYSQYTTTSRPLLTFWRACWTFLKWEFALAGILKLAGDLLQLIGPLGIAVIVDYVAQPDDKMPLYPTAQQFWSNGWTMAAVILIASVAQSSCSQTSTHLVNVAGIRLNAAIQAKIYSKSLRISSAPSSDQSQNFDDGLVTHLLSEDTLNVMSAFWVGHYIWAIPLKMALLMYLLYIQLGVSALVGSAVTILTLAPLQLWVGRAMSRNSSELSDITDDRLQKMGSLIQRIKLLKMLGWTDIFMKNVMNVRQLELVKLDKDSVCWASMTFLTHIASIMIAAITLATHFMLNSEPIRADALFTSLALINQLTVTLFIFPVTVPIFIAAWVSGKRLANFFVQKEIDKTLQDPETTAASSSLEFPTSRPTGNEYRYERIGTDIEMSNLTENGFSLSATTLTEDFDIDAEDESITSGDIALSVTDGEFAWSDSKENRLVLGNISIQRGKMTMIVGKVGSGKSSFLSAILGEMPLVKGNVDWNKKTTVAYAGQSPWLLNGTIRDNITFGRPFIPRRYMQVIAACALQPDLDILPDKDLTEIGEKGINLSGGQKQRIGVARTLYSRANFVILDDPLSSLDNAVATQVFEDGIKRLVRRGKRTVLLVTHHLHLLVHSDKVIVMEDNSIRIQGQLNDIETLDTPLVSSWREAMGVKETSDHKGRTARERWQLVKMVSSYGQEWKQRMDPNWQEEDAAQLLSRKPTRRKMSPLAEWNYLSHDLPIVSDQCGIVRPSWRQPSRRSRQLARANSLQARPIRTTPVTRQMSSPLVLSRHRGTRSSSSRSLLRHIARARTPPTDVSRKVPHPLERMSSTESGFSDATSEVDPDENLDLDVVGGGTDSEEREYGRIPRRVFIAFATAAGVPLVLLYFVLTIAWQVSRAFTDAWLSIWTDSADDDQWYYIAIYGALSVLAVVLSISSHGVGQYVGAKARVVLHNRLVEHIVECPVAIFESIPAGRFMNRFSTDIGVIDKKLGTALQRTIQFLLLCVSALLINTAITPWFIIVAVPVCLLYYLIQRFYRTSSRELQRLESISRSPIVSHLLETLSGLPTIRAFRFEEKFTSAFLTKLDVHMNAFLILNSSNRWLGIVLDSMGGFIVYLAIITALITSRMSGAKVSSSLVGLAISYTLLVPIYLNWVVKFLSECEMYMGAVERINQMMQLPIEENITDVKKKDDWPAKGEIRFGGVSLGYGPTREPVFLHLNLHIPAGQKVGICGRTGSGKSTLGLSLFRLVDIIAGQISIDDVDLSSLPLSVVRGRIAVVPQNADLLPGSVRENLDPAGRISDADLWAALDAVQLRALVTNQFGDLDGDLAEGFKLSSGERQLFCLARAVVRRSAVLLMDEATSSLDADAEQGLMAAAHKAFQGKTMIIIAHRLQTLLSCDRILVLERGIIAEDGSPQQLLAKPMGLFSSMLRTSEDYT